MSLSRIGSKTLSQPIDIGTKRGTHKEAVYKMSQDDSNRAAEAKLNGLIQPAECIHPLAQTSLKLLPYMS